MFKIWVGGQNNMNPSDLNISEEDLANSILKTNNFPAAVKKQILDEQGNLTDSSKKFIAFFSVLTKVFMGHFIEVITQYSPQQTWETLLDPAPCFDEICSSFQEDYQKNILDKMPKKTKKNIDIVFPEGLILLLHKRFVLSSMFSLPNTIISKEMLLYYRSFVDEPLTDDENCLLRLMDILKDFQEKMNHLNNLVQEEWQNHALDIYNKKMMSKELMEFVMSESNKQKEKLSGKKHD